MKKFRVFIILSVSWFFIPTAFAQTEGTIVDKEASNFIILNPAQYFVNEINIGYEHYLSKNKSFEINGGYIYRNDFWLNLTDDWIQSQYFREHGFALRAYYKFYKKANEKNNNRSFYSFGVNYQYLYFDDEWLETGKPYTLDSTIMTEPQHPYKKAKVGEEQILMNRFRHRFGVQLLLGNLIPLGSNFFLEFYYGLGLRGIFSKRTDVARITTIDEIGYYQDLNFKDTDFYIRPTIHAGVKLKLGW